MLPEEALVEEVIKSLEIRLKEVLKSGMSSTGYVLLNAPGYSDSPISTVAHLNEHIIAKSRFQEHLSRGNVFGL